MARLLRPDTEEADEQSGRAVSLLQRSRWREGAWPREI